MRLAKGFGGGVARLRQRGHIAGDPVKREAAARVARRAIGDVKRNPCRVEGPEAALQLAGSPLFDRPCEEGLHLLLVVWVHEAKQARQVGGMRAEQPRQIAVDVQPAGRRIDRPKPDAGLGAEQIVELPGRLEHRRAKTLPCRAVEASSARSTGTSQV